MAGSQASHAAGDADAFAENMAMVFPDIAAARAAFRADRVVFGATGGGGVRSSDYYGWAAVSRRCVERTWGAVGLELVRWRPSGELFSQELAILVRTRVWPWQRGVRGIRHAVARQVVRVAALLPASTRAAVRRRIAPRSAPRSR